MLRPFARSLSIAILFFANSFCSNKLVLCFAILIEFHPVTRLIQATFSLACMFCFLYEVPGAFDPLSLSFSMRTYAREQDGI